ncbi:MAG TPA: hypothetical protein VJ783_12580 [Pirellulales bacterium]|nr:hypothetical protein [Pirellulales bacterium]
MIGRTDVVLSAPECAPVGEIVVDVCRRYWPQAIFQNVDDEQTHPLDGGEAWEHAASSNEFFVFRDSAAAESWERLGAVPENANTLLHFLIRDRDGLSADRELTCVCDALTGDVDQIIDSIKSELGHLAKS